MKLIPDVLTVVRNVMVLLSVCVISSLYSVSFILSLKLECTYLGTYLLSDEEHADPVFIAMNLYACLESQVAQ